MDTTLEAARRAKEKAKALGAAAGEVIGVGLTRIGGSYAVKVNLRASVTNPLPQEIDGVPVVYEVVGIIKKRGV